MTMTTTETLRSAWSQALDVDQEEIEEASNFVELGGDSVKAIQLAEIAQSHGIALDAEAIYYRAEVQPHVGHDEPAQRSSIRGWK